MYERLIYAADTSVKSLHAVVASKSKYEIPLAFTLTIGGFVAMQFGLNYDVSNPVIVGIAVGTVLLLSTIGFITIIGIIFVFAYGFTVGAQRSVISPKLNGWSRSWRIILSCAVSGAVTAAIFNLFDEGLKQISFIPKSFFLYDGN